jgi:hypothetical protein
MVLNTEHPALQEYYLFIFLDVSVCALSLHVLFSVTGAQKSCMSLELFKITEQKL